MSSRFPAASGALIALVLLAGCDRENRDSRGQPVTESVPFAETTDLYAGEAAPSPPDPRAAMYEGNAYHLSQGQQLFKWMNCTGCHANGGGGIGPPLIDDEWRYGGRMEQIAATIVHGRPNGMPSFRGKLTEQQVWELAAYVRSMSGQVAKDVANSRGDTVSNTEPGTLKEPEPVVGSSPASVQGTAQ